MRRAAFGEWRTGVGELDFCIRAGQVLADYFAHARMRAVSLLIGEVAQVAFDSGLRRDHVALAESGSLRYRIIVDDFRSTENYARIKGEIGLDHLFAKPIEDACRFVYGSVAVVKDTRGVPLLSGDIKPPG